MKARTRFRAPAGLKLRDADAGATPLRDNGGMHPKSKDQIKAHERELTDALTAKISLHQQMLYSQRKQKVLLVLQGMDTSGKDGTVRALFSRINPMGLNATQFKAPSLDEAAHDFLWRIHPHVPGAGEIAIFNRSHYEDVLVTRVQKLIDDKECKRRYAHIADFERLLAETGTVIVKVFLHISKEEQRARLQARLDDPEKQWKFDENDIVQRKRWDDYRDAYERAIGATDADHAPWYIIPADSKTHRNLLIATLLLEVMEDLNLAFPEPDPRLSALKID
ncbi:polyphosphate kinase 2 family protein [Massilia sp. CCM 8695]|uniref:Polyphosphate kinase 2 family protein n=1 Tax=Massilia frigida TaxID=2609281 RepID=A0ABX0NEH1_9BURK|nr:PPK2 family polyphosphate kinase [Massilia frigida]NHZ82753.1 polyphosphate kinase 2 family protein [Massilia frigida]